MGKAGKAGVGATLIVGLGALILRFASAAVTGPNVGESMAKWIAWGKEPIGLIVGWVFFFVLFLIFGGGRK